MTTSSNAGASPPPLTVERSQGDEAVVIALRGELDMATLPIVQGELDAVEAGLPALLIIDLSRLGFVDSSGVRLVLLAEDRARSDGRRLAVRLGAGPAYRLFDTLGLVDRFDIVDSAAVEQGNLDSTR